jgi:hypothetical protein
MSNYNHKYLERKVKPGGGYIYVYKEKDQPQKDKIYLDKLPEGTNISDVDGIYLSKWGNTLARVKTTNRYTERYGQGKDFFDVNTLRQKYLVRETGNAFARVGSVSDKFALGPEKEYWVKVKLKELTPEQFTAVERKLKDNDFKEVYGGNIDKITEKQFKSVINKTYSDIQNNEDSVIANAVDRIVSDIGKKKYGDNWDYSEDKMNIIWNSLPGIYILNKAGNKFKYIVVKKGEGVMKKSFQKLVKSVWTNQYINDLPDSAFLYIELGGKKDESGKTVPRDLRHFPFKDINGKIDLAHIRNAIARIPQSKCGLSAKEMEALQNKARNILEGNKGIEKGFYIRTIGSNYRMGEDSFKKSLEQVKKGINALASLEKANRSIYYGPRGGKYSDPEHKIPYTEEAPVSKKNPWEMSSSQWLSVNKIHEPWIGEISPMQYSKLSNRAKKEYDIKRNKEWALANKGKEDWRNEIYLAYKSGKFKLEDKGLNPEVINAVKQKESSEMQEKKQQSFEDAVKNNKISNVSEVKMGDRVFHIIYRQYGVINKIGKNTVSLVLSNGDKMKVKPSLLNRYSYSDLQNKYGVNKSMQNAVTLLSNLNADLEKGAMGGKYIKREPKPGGGYRHSDLENIPVNWREGFYRSVTVADNMPIRPNPPVLQPHEWMRRENAIYEREMTRDDTIDLKLIGSTD